MKEVPQKTAYVVIDPAWGEPEIIDEGSAQGAEVLKAKLTALGLNMEAEHA